MKRYAIVGFGCAGYHAAKAIRSLDKTGELHVFDRLNMPPFNPMLSTYYASDRISLDGVFPFGNLDSLCSQLDLQFHGGQTVSSISQNTLTLEDGSSYFFDAILVSTGARALLPPLKGLPDSRVLVMRTLEDAERLRARLASAPPRRAVVVGGSMVGIKVAELLAARGVEVTIADGADWLFPLAAFPHVGRELERRLTLRGLRFTWGAMVREISPEGVVLTSGALLPADLICLCIGTRAEADTVSGPGCGVQVGRGIVVDGNMSTSCPGIYAAGDCCEGTELQSGQTMPIGLWANAARQGEAAGRAMAGHPEPYAGNIIHNITHFMGLDFVGLGDSRREGEPVVWGELSAGPYIEARVRDGSLQCVNLLDCRRAAGILKSLLLAQLDRPGCGLTPVQTAALLGCGISREFIRKIGGNRHV